MSRDLELSRQTALSALGPSPSVEAEPYLRLYDHIAGLVEANGYAPYAYKDHVIKGLFGKRTEERLVPSPIELSNGATVDARATFEPCTRDTGSYSARNYPRGAGSDASMVARVFPYTNETAGSKYFYGTSGLQAAMVADRIGGVEGTPQLYALSTGSMPTYRDRPEGYGFKPIRTLLIARAAGMAALRTYPRPGTWKDMLETRVTPDGARYILSELQILLEPGYADMEPCSPQFDSVPDVSQNPSSGIPPYSNRQDWTHRWQPLHSK